MFVDSHCHLDRVDLTRYAGDFDQLIQATRAAGVGRMLCVAIDLEHYPAMRRLVDPYPEIVVSVGVHPNEMSGAEPTLDQLVTLADDPRVVAIGETGLDCYRGTADLDAQRQRLRVHVAAARQVGKPLIIHTRDAGEETLRILREEGAEAVGGVLHCFTESWEIAKAGMDLGFSISFSGIITFKSAGDLREVARRVPLDRLLIETDSPYLAPVPHRGKPNEPKHVTHVADAIAALRGMERETIAAVTRANYLELFGIAPEVSGPAS
ncbi:MAG: TatD family deoxyribonuclease [Sphingobacteriia bacterium]|nr:TatD family deoxyribonuclease [Sphingobacteriia bacterium]NCC38176.1 TatD family deoxyribonuclease [Gammaproteobacteria bacterium]